ncbi:CYTH and CHAD domain-containing protein [Propionivibrio sp.]|uniref:CYTH and CHAD domain-containing protein n=1 Tax=Propionivibrio sp. TaxID=2212460 RepID=UPI002604E81D|nr:CYTH and CHAD domain-containing protein [Propionivibrio sp.]
MSKEIELKLRLSPAQARRLQSCKVLSGLQPQKYRLLNTYYDTPDFDLRQRGVAVRFRRKGWAVWLMTVKAGAPSAGGLAQRSEWEAPTQAGVFDFSIVTDAKLRAFLASHQAQLQAVFSTDFTRTTWMLNQAGAIVELALDRGRINVPGVGKAPRSEALCELELELLEGESPDPLFNLAIALAADLQLHPEIVSKAERGYALADDAAANPVKALASSVEKSMTPVEAFRSIALSCLMQLQGNEAGAIAGDNPEYVHQARVAIRRLRSAFNLFTPVLNQRFVEIYSSRWKQLAGGLGSARDWDVFLTETLAPLEEAFPGDADLAVLRARGEATKAKAQASAGVALKQKAYSQLLLAFSAALFRVEPPTIDAQCKSSALSLRKFAVRRLYKRAQMIERLVSEHGKMNAERRHDLRIAFKKLRYALEFFAPILPRKRLAACQASLAMIQNLLGTLNDQVTASRLIKQMHPKSDPDPLSRGWIAGRTQLLVAALNDELRGFTASRKPWP